MLKSHYDSSIYFLALRSKSTITFCNSDEIYLKSFPFYSVLNNSGVNIDGARRTGQDRRSFYFQPNLVSINRNPASGILMNNVVMSLIPLLFSMQLDGKTICL